VRLKYGPYPEKAEEEVKSDERQGILPIEASKQPVTTTTTEKAG
jgi:hypothetical protein